MLMKFANHMAAENFLNEQGNWRSWFKWLNSGICKDHKFNRLAWIRFHGLPINLRSNENVAAAASKLGEVLEMDGHNWHNTDLSSATARILTTERKLINTEIHCSFGEKSFKFGVVECSDAWDPISSYYDGVSQAIDKENHDEVDVNGDLSTSECDNEGISDTEINDVEEGEIVAESGA